MGVYDVTQNAGWVSVGVDHDTAAFAAQSIRRWWESMGAEAYPDARKLLITAGQLLQFQFPKPHSGTVTPAGIGLGRTEDTCFTISDPESPRSARRLSGE